MWFNSLTFAVFMPTVYLLYRLLPHRGQNVMLLVASYVFYGAWDWRFLGLIGISTLVDYCVGLLLPTAEGTRRRVYLWISICTNLGILGTFKYFGFFSDSLKDLFELFGLTASWPTIYLVLPVGISFYTFQTLSYTIDIYRGSLKPTRNILDFALFVAFFPQLVAGPIERATNLIPQIVKPRILSLDQTTRGLYLILFGLLKKVVIADGVAPSVNAVFGSTGTVSTAEIVFACYLFTVQIYCDFSGYSDIARGLAKLMGFDLMTNFRTPYFSANPAELWERWHISLSTWLRDYVYFSFGGNRKGELRTYVNLMATMVIGGLWHGSSWNFALWGLYNGTWLCAHRALSRGADGSKRRHTRMRHLINIVLCYHGWVLSAMFFRGTSLDQIILFLRTVLFDFSDWAVRMPDPSIASLIGIPILFAMDVMEYRTGRAQYYRRLGPVFRSALYATLFFLTLMGMSNAPIQFFYFQF